jgi:predicted DNA binding CopG/RHH family protein
MSMIRDQEEKDLLDSYDQEEWESVISTEMKARYEAAAQAAFKKDKRVNIRISNQDLELIQERALREGVPYQTLMASILHKYVRGRLTEND